MTGIGIGRGGDGGEVSVSDEFYSRYVTEDGLIIAPIPGPGVWGLKLFRVNRSSGITHINCQKLSADPYP